MLPTALKKSLASVRSVGAITGAGISAESGIPTYRGKGGLYDDPETGDRTIEDLSGQTLRRDPARTWRAIRDLAKKAQGARPNAGHDALAKIEQTVEQFTLLTQNVDGLHEQAGSQNVIAIHGDVHATVCMKCECASRFESLHEIEGLPRCTLCGGILRPDVVLFGEMLPHDRVFRIRQSFYAHVPDLILVAGTSALFPYIAEPVLLARQLGRLTVEINPEETFLSEVVDYSLRGSAGAILPEIADLLEESRP